MSNGCWRKWPQANKSQAKLEKAQREWRIAAEIFYPLGYRLYGICFGIFVILRSIFDWGSDMRHLSKYPGA